MDFKQIDHIADLINPLFAIALLAVALATRKSAAWPFIVRIAIAAVLVVVVAKLVQPLHLFHHSVTSLQKSHRIKSQFPSTHFAFALCIATAFFLLNKRYLWVSVLVPIVYGALMLYQQYHTPLEMMAAVYAIPLTWGIHLIGPRQKVTPSGEVVTN